MPMQSQQQFASLQGNTSNLRSVENRMQILAGSDFITSLRVKGTNEIINPSDRILLKQPISATSFLGTRVSGLSQFWERYRWRKAEMRYVPAVPNTVACQLIAYIDTDPLDDPAVITDTDALLRQAVAQVGSRQWNFNSPRTIPLIVRKDDQLYYTGLDKQNVRFSLQGILYIIQVTNLLDFGGQPVNTGYDSGSVFLDWTLELTMPQINPSFESGSDPEPTPPPLSNIAIVQVAAGPVPTAAGPINISGLNPNLQHLFVLSFAVAGSTLSSQGAVITNTESNVSLEFFIDNDDSSVNLDNALQFTATSSGTIAPVLSAYTPATGGSPLPFPLANTLQYIVYSVQNTSV
jgi:hypothetical protein